MARGHVRHIEETLLSENWGLVKRTGFELRRRDGSWQHQVRETYDNGPGAGILLYSLAQRSVVLTRQFRYPAFANGEEGYLLEVCAGKLDGDDAAACALKEAEEETGYRLRGVEQVFECYSSPGAVMEKLTLFVAAYDPEDRISEGGGLQHEGEDIEVVELPFDTLMAMLKRGEIQDAKTLILLQYAAMSVF